MGFCVNSLLGELLKEYRYNTILKKQSNDLKQSCENLTITETGRCLNKELKKIFNYNISNVGKKITIEELEKEGGVCDHYASWYVQKGKELGFISEKFVFKYGNGKAHAIAIISNEEGYCFMDMIYFQCFEWAKDIG